MQMTVNAVLLAGDALASIARRAPSMPQVGKYRLARMHRKLAEEYEPAAKQRADLIRKFGLPEDRGNIAVDPAKMDDYLAEWAPIGALQVDVDVEAVLLDGLTFPGLNENGPLEVGELVALGDLVTE